MDKAIHALDMKWHPEHFICQSCGKSLAGISFLKKNGKPVCKSCYAKLKARGMIYGKPFSCPLPSLRTWFDGVLIGI